MGVRGPDVLLLAYFYDRIFLCSYHPTLLTISSRADLTDICLGPPAWEKR